MSPQFNRLLWKEFRTQRSLWLALTGAMLFFQGLFYVLLTLDHNRNDFVLQPILGIAVVLVTCFMIASAVVAFAGEEDQGTAIWLRLFPMSTGTLFWSKIAMTAISCLVMAAIAGCVTLLVLLLQRETLPAIKSPSELWYVPFVPVSLLTIAVFWSLLSRSVFQALGLIGATLFAIGVVSPALSLNATLALMAFGGTALLSLIPLSYRWHRGLPLQRGGRKTRAVMKLSDSLRRPAELFVLWAGIPALGFLLLATAVWVTLRISGGAGPDHLLRIGFAFCAGPVVLALACWFYWPGAWQRRLTKSATRSSQLGRTSSVLFWREWRLAVPSALLAVALGIVAVVARLTISPVPWTTILLWIVVLEFGLRTFRHDQQKLHGLFWSHRGISPALVYGIRTSMWLGLLIVVAGTLVVLDFPARGGSMSRSGPATEVQAVVEGVLRESQPHISWKLGGDANHSVVVTFASQLSFGITWLVGGFAIGQLCSCWFRKPLIAFFFAACGFATFQGGLLYSVFADIPFWLCAWPMIAVAFLAVFRSRRDWMDRRESLSIGLKRLAFVLIPLLCVLPLHEGRRILQVAAGGPDLVEEAIWEGYSAEAQNNQWAKQWDNLNEATQPLRNKREAVEAPVKLDDEQMQQAQAAIRHLFEEHDRRQLPPKLKQPWVTYPAQPLAFAVIQDAESLLKGDEPFKAMEGLIKGAYLLRFLQQQASSWDQYYWSMELEQYVLQHLHHVAADDQLQPEQLKIGARDLAEFIENPIDVAWMLANREAVYRQVLHRSGYLWELHKDNAERNPLFNARFTERMRFLNLMFLSDNATMYNGYPAETSDMQRWIATTITTGTDLLQDPGFHGDRDRVKNSQVIWGNFRKPQHELQDTERATWLILQAQAYRREHGEFPNDVKTLLDATREYVDHERSQMLGDLQYRFGLGLRKDGLAFTSTTRAANGRVVEIAATQPVLISKDARPSPKGEDVTAPSFSGHRTLTLNPNRIVYLNGSATVPPAGGIEQPESDK